MARISEYRLDVRIVPEPIPEAFEHWGGRIEATAWLNLDLSVERGQASEASLELALYRLLHVRQITVGSSREALEFVTRVREYPDHPTYQARIVILRLSDLLSRLDAQGRVAIELHYGGPICGAIEALPYVHDHISARYTLLRPEVIWYPVVYNASFGAQLAKHVPYELAVTCPPGQTPVAGGALLQTEPVAAPSGAPAGEPWMKWTWQAQAPEFMAISCANYGRLESTDGRVSLYHFHEHAPGAALAMVAVDTTVRLCTKWLGPVDQAPVAIAEIPERWGSQFSRLLILQTADAFADTDAPDAQRRLYSALGHELAHAWSVPSLEPHSTRWLDEGMTHFVEAMLLRDACGPEAYDARLAAYRSRFLRDIEHVRDLPILAPGVQRYRECISRGKGPWVLAVLRELVGEECLFTILREFTQRYRKSGATPADFVAVAAELAPLDLNGFFHDWLDTATASSALLEQHSTPAAIAAHYRG